MSRQLLFVTGTGRSGTTLVDKLLWSLPGVDSFSQPLPLLFVELKRRFLRDCGREVEGVPPLSDQQFANHGVPGEFERFLRWLDLDEAWLRGVLASQVSYTGQYFKPDDPFGSMTNWSGGGLADFVETYFRVHRQKGDASWQAFKETFAEEFIPYWLDNGSRALLVLRDPRDVLLSVSHGESATHAGLPRPLLFVARQWRKSALHGLGLRHERLKTIRYEDLVAEPSDHLEDWSRWLKLPAANAPAVNELKGQDGLGWKSNSSFERKDGIFESAVGRYRKHLPEHERRLIEALCFAEMTALGYEPAIDRSEVPALLAQGWPGEALHRPSLASYRLTEARIGEELDRWLHIVAATAEYRPEQFIFERAYDALRAAMAASS